MASTQRNDLFDQHQLSEKYFLKSIYENTDNQNTQFSEINNNEYFEKNGFSTNRHILIPKRLESQKTAKEIFD